MDNWNKNTSTSPKEQSCLCKSSKGLFMTSRHTSFAVAVIIVMIFFAFIAGFFQGKREQVKLFAQKTETDSFADQIYSSMCALYDIDRSSSETDEACEESDAVAQQDIEAESKDMSESKLVAQSTDGESPDSAAPIQEKLSDQKYYAQLVGFGTKKAADRYAQKLKNKEFPVEVKTRISKTSKGRKIAWYQVVTHACDNKEQLEVLVDRISKVETLKGVRFVAL